MKSYLLPQFIKDKIPTQTIGVYSDSQNCRKFKNEEVAQQFFQHIKDRILDINHWNLFAGQYKASFTLTNPIGEKKTNAAEIGDFIKIKLPELHHLFLDEADWVKIECLEFVKESDYQMLFICLKPSANPCDRKKNTSHFFTSSSSNSIILFQTTEFVQLSVHGRNKFPNVFTPNKLMKLRNFIIANLGYFGLSKFQWQGFADGMMKD